MSKCSDENRFSKNEVLKGNRFEAEDEASNSIEKKRSGFEIVTSHLRTIEYLIFLVAMRLGDTPVLIPNTTVKTETADGTMLETAWESRWLPD